ncbi:DUF5317 domain-containing protein [Marinithermus hydrothermalis]|uniref:DUF5317 domain-containing protein n=1 Tax=Marinithermus hydrothermalis TaxID=186192 RepID=UPI0011D1E184|nr:DUF5317 domain-containing protein [Marinithermus hydrothermalis]
MDLRAPWAFIAAALAEGGLAYATYQGLLSPSLSGPLAKTLVVGFVGYGIYANRGLKSLWLVLTGLGLNLAVMAANGGHMPVSATALQAAGIGHWVPLLETTRDGVHTLLTPTTPLGFLGDTIPLSFMRKVISPGDVFILLGIIGVVVEGGLRAKKTRLQA